MVAMIMAVRMVMPVLVFMIVMVMVVAGAGALDVVVVAFLGQADFRLEAEDLGAVLAKRTVHGGLAMEDLLDAFGEGIDDARVVV